MDKLSKGSWGEGTIAKSIISLSIVSWGALLDIEQYAKAQLAAMDDEIGITLFDEFKPNLGGQTKFFQMMPLDSIVDYPHRWASLIGGIGCIAGETLIGGVPVRELATDPIEVDTLLGKAIATPAFIKGQANLYRVVTRTGKQILVTKGHRFLSPRGWIPLHNLDCGAIVACHDTSGELSHSNSYWDTIEAIEYVRFDDFYDLHVPGANHYLAQGIWHHNSGKSFCGAAWATSRGILSPKSRGLIAANTFGQLARSTLITLVEVCRQFNIPLDPYRESIEDNALAIANRQRCYIGEQRAFAYVLSMSSFTGKTQAARGLQVRWAWIDEAAFSDEKSFLTLDGRLGRGPGNLKGQGLITTSPAGFNWLYDRFGDLNRTDDRKRLYVMVSCSTRENVKYLGEDYVAGLQANYTDELAAQELEGAFINANVGRVYKYFDRRSHALQGVDAEIIAYDPKLPLHVTFDFNYNPAVCVLAQLRQNEIHFFREFYVLDSDTWEISEMVCQLIKESNHLTDIYIYGDATGAARSAASRLSNWDIVFDAFAKIGYRLEVGGKLHRRIDKVNPSVRNRINSFNCLLKQNRVFFDMGKCPELIKDLEILNYSGEGIDKSDILRSHLSDAAGYLLHKLYPYKMLSVRPQGSQKRQPKGII